MKALFGFFIFIYSSVSFSQISYSDFTQIYDKVFLQVLEEDTKSLDDQYKKIFTLEFNKVFLSDTSKQYFFDAFDKKLVKTYLEGESFGATYAALLRTEGAKRLSPILQRQQTLYSRKALNYANAKECSAIIQNKPITKQISNRNGIDLYSNLPLNDFKKYMETYTKSAFLIFNGRDESYAVDDAELDKLNKIFINTLKDKLSEQKLINFVTVLNNGFAKSSDEDVCEVGKILLDTILTAGNTEQSQAIINAWIKGRLLKN